MKRSIDIVLALFGLVLFSPFCLLIALAVKLNSRGPVFFTQKRVGKNFKLFTLYKFRSMVTGVSGTGPQITAGGDSRVTPLGRFMRKYKIDEFPQAINVLKGDMSIVGPRPEVDEFVQKHRKDYEKILSVRPGMTDIASLHFINEESLLFGKIDPETYYCNYILPEKIKLSKEYVRKSSICFDLKLIAGTFFKLAYPNELLDGILEKVSGYRRPLVIMIEVVIFAISNYLAFAVRFDSNIPGDIFNLFLLYLPSIMLFRLIFLFSFSIDRGLWRYVSTRDLFKIAGAITSGTVLFFVTVRYLFGETSYPMSIYLLDWFFNMTLLTGVRFVRQVHDKVLSFDTTLKNQVIIVGAEDAADMLIREITQSPYCPYRVLGLVDDDPEKKGTIIRGVPVLGTRKNLKKIIEDEEPDELLVAMPLLSSVDLDGVVKELREYGVPIKVVPGILSLLTGKNVLQNFDMLNPEDVLFRESTENVDELQLYEFIEGKSVMVTGAGGSIGSELSRQIAAHKPQRLILFERHEESLYSVGIDFVKTYGEEASFFELVIGDVTDRCRVNEVMQKYRPDIVFHAAAYKHVPLMESNQSEAIKTNVGGTRIIAEESSASGVDMFVQISTDKAVNPVNIMGKTKAMAEGIVRSLGAEHGNNTRFITVRFGNVLGSSGSVVPLFKDQIKKGGPVTVTHPDITRFFMTIPEAVRLVLHAAILGEGGELFVLDMGEPIKIVDLARRMINLYGYKPGFDIEIVFTGLRSGEKLHEELFNDKEKVMQTTHHKIMKVEALEPSLHEQDVAAKLYKEVDAAAYEAGFKKVVEGRSFEGVSVK